MTTTFVWHDLKQLVVLDYDIHQLHKAISKEQDAISTARSAHQKNITLLHDIELAARGLQKELDREELSSKDLRAQLTKKKNQLASLMNNKERIALEHEIAKIILASEELDTTMMRLMDQQESIKTSFEKQKQATSTTETQLHLLEKKAKAQQEEYEARLKTLETEWESLLENVPVGLRSEYLQLKKRVKNPAVPVQAGSCSACFMNLLQTDASHLSPRSVIKCRNCFRFLYLPDATTEKIAS